MGRSVLDMGGCQSYSSSDEEDVSALKANYTNVSLFKVVHYQDAIAVELHPHLNTLFTHFITFSHTFRLLEPSETAPIDELIAVLTHF